MWIWIVAKQNGRHNAEMFCYKQRISHIPQRDGWHYAVRNEWDVRNSSKKTRVFVARAIYKKIPVTQIVILRQEKIGIIRK